MKSSFLFLLCTSLLFSGCGLRLPQVSVPLNNATPISDPAPAIQQKQNINNDQPKNDDISFQKLFEGQIDAPLWLFAVIDDEEQVVLSAEKDQEIIMAKFDPNNPKAKLNWKTIISKTEVGGVADHWHVFAHGYHYFVFSQPKADSAYAVKVDKNFNRVAIKHIVDRYEVPKKERPPFGGEYLITNDMFLVPESEGVTAAFFLPTIGHKLFRMDKNLNVYETKNIGGGNITHGNGSSAIMTKKGFDVLASDTIMLLQQSGVQLLQYDKNWNFVEAKELVDNDNQSIGMVSGVYLDDGGLVLHSRTNVNAYGRGEMPPPPTQGVLTDDGGNIARYLFDPDGQLVSTDYLYEGTNAHRPHTALLNDLLITTWDGGKSGTTLRIDKIQ
jgi:hypothetical protein